MRIEHEFYYSSHKTPKERPYPIGGGKIERLAWEEHHARCVSRNSYPISGGKIEKRAWERAHSWE